LAGGQQARYAPRILARNQHHGEAVDFAVACVGVAVEQVVGTRGLKRDRQGVGLDRTIDDAGSLQIFGEEVIPGVHLFGVDQENGARDVGDFGKVLRGSLSDIHNADVGVGRQCRGPGDGNCTQCKWLGRYHGYSRRPFRPTCLDGEALGINAVCACGLETRCAPVDRLLHGCSARHTSANVVGQLLQVGFQG